LDLQTVVGKADVRGECGLGGGVVQIMAHVNEVGASGLELFDDRNGLVEMRMTGVRVAPERVEDQYVEALKQGEAYVRNIAHVGQVGCAAEAIACDLLASVGYGDAAKACAEQVHSGSWSGIDAVNFDPRAGGVAVLFAKGVLEDTFDTCRRRVVGVDRQIALHTKTQRSQVIEAHYVVCVAVGVEHGVDTLDALPQRLCMKVRARVDEYDVPVIGEADRWSGAAVTRVRGSAYRTVAAESWHTHRGAGSKKGEGRFHRSADDAGANGTGPRCAGRLGNGGSRQGLGDLKEGHA
jgi:hypothetical protein